MGIKVVLNQQGCTEQVGQGISAMQSTIHLLSFLNGFGVDYSNGVDSLCLVILFDSINISLDYILASCLARFDRVLDVGNCRFDENKSFFRFGVAGSN